MNFRFSILVLAVLGVVAAGCSSVSDILPDSKKIDYKSSGKVPTLEVPPDLSQIARDDRYAVPDAAGKGSATFSADSPAGRLIGAAASASTSSNPSSPASTSTLRTTLEGLITPRRPWMLLSWRA